MQVAATNSLGSDSDQRSQSFKTISYFAWRPGTIERWKMRRKRALYATAVNTLATIAAASQQSPTTIIFMPGTAASGYYSWYLTKQIWDARIENNSPQKVGPTYSTREFNELPADGTWLTQNTTEFVKLATPEPSGADIKWAHGAGNVKTVYKEPKDIRTLLSTF